MRVLVAGAGLAGLHAAWLLRQAGHDVAVYEARARVGGRVWSQRLDNGVWIERGAEFIFPSEHVILGLCARLRLPVTPHGVLFFRRADQEGRVPSVEHVLDVRERLAAASLAEGAGEQRRSVAELFETALGERFGGDPVFLRQATSMTSDPRLASAAGEALGDAVDRDGYLDHTYRVVGGNQQMALRMAADLSGCLRLETPVRAVHQAGDAVELTLHDGSCVAGDAVVVAVPFPLLGELERNFAWPGPIERALTGLVMGSAVKASVPLRTGSAPRGVQVPERWWAWNSLSPGDDRSGPAATAFASTAPDLPAGGGDAPWGRMIQELRPDLDVEGDALVTDWARESWTRGSYTVRGLSWRPEDDRAFNAPVGRVVLAGEHTGTNGDMEGALWSGRRAARLLSACYG